MLPFTKMHGLGNDYVYLNGFEELACGDLSELARKMSDRRFGVGSDGLILISPSAHADARMRMFNADGTEAEMCGNGIRCVAKFLFDRHICRRDQLSIETAKGVLGVELITSDGCVDRVRVDMGPPQLTPRDLPATFAGQTVINAPLRIDELELVVTCVSMGNPHCVVFAEALTDDWVARIGPRLETHGRFPNRTNVEFVVVESPDRVRQRTWERGTGETLACGTGACAVCVAGVLTGRTNRQLNVELRGGALQVHWNESNNHVTMEGPATEVFTGVWPADS